MNIFLASSIIENKHDHDDRTGLNIHVSQTFAVNVRSESTYGLVYMRHTFLRCLTSVFTATHCYNFISEFFTKTITILDALPFPYSYNSHLGNLNFYNSPDRKAGAKMGKGDKKAPRGKVKKGGKR